MLDLFKRVVVGRPIPSYHAEHHRFGLFGGLAVLSSDALSSVAYATEEVLRVLMVGGIASLAIATPISLLIATLLLIVVFSYRQTIEAYPGGGGAYIVARDNLGPGFGLAAAAALLIDYTLTVAVSIAAGVSAITSAIPALHVNRVVLALVFIAILMLGNLRGLKESTKLFGIPVYGFVGVMFVLILTGISQIMTGHAVPIEPVDPLPTLGTGAITVFVLLSAFSNGCTAMTGVEAVSDGVPAFKAPVLAKRTLALMAVIATSMFLGISVLAHAYHVVPSETETVVSQPRSASFSAAIHTS